MKHFNLLLVALIFAVSGCTQATGQIQNPEPPREKGQESVLQLAVDPIPTVRVGFIGLGNRGTGAVTRYTYIEGVEIKYSVRLGCREGEKIARHVGKKRT